MGGSQTRGLVKKKGKGERLRPAGFHLPGSMKKDVFFPTAPLSPSFPFSALCFLLQTVAVELNADETIGSLSPDRTF